MMFAIACYLLSVSAATVAINAVSAATYRHLLSAIFKYLPQIFLCNLPERNIVLTLSGKLHRTGNITESIIKSIESIFSHCQS